MRAQRTIGKRFPVRQPGYQEPERSSGRSTADTIMEKGDMLGTILIIILILILVGALPSWGYSRSWGYGPSGGLGLILVIIIILVLLGRV
jgi:uncharacterized membrane protein YkgB